MLVNFYRLLRALRCLSTAGNAADSIELYLFTKERDMLLELLNARWNKSRTALLLALDQQH